MKVSSFSTRILCPLSFYEEVQRVVSSAKVSTSHPCNLICSSFRNQYVTRSGVLMGHVYVYGFHCDVCLKRFNDVLFAKAEAAHVILISTSL